MAAELSGEANQSTSRIHFELKLDNDSSAARTEWAKSMQYFPFSGHMVFRRDGTSRLSVEETFRLGTEKFGQAFCDQVMSWMERVGYSVADIMEVERKPGTRGLAVIEPRHQKETAFRHLSQAQQRTLTLLVYLTFLELEKKPVTVLVDDFAEGLDFERARQLGKVILEKNKESALQLILATNDRYVMNVVPIELWTVLVEDGTTTRVFNYLNSKQKFDDFKFTGLNNFDFFSMDFAQQERA